MRVFFTLTNAVHTGPKVCTLHGVFCVRQGDHIGRLLPYWKSILFWLCFWKSQNQITFVGSFFRVKSDVLILTENMLGYTFSDFFSNESGRSGVRPLFQRRNSRLRAHFNFFFCGRFVLSTSTAFVISRIFVYVLLMCLNYIRLEIKTVWYLHLVNEVYSDK
jgi:hypothetical protein